MVFDRAKCVDEFGHDGPISEPEAVYQERHKALSREGFLARYKRSHRCGLNHKWKYIVKPHQQIIQREVSEFEELISIAPEGRSVHSFCGSTSSSPYKGTNTRSSRSDLYLED